MVKKRRKVRSEFFPFNDKIGKGAGVKFSKTINFFSNKWVNLVLFSLITIGLLFLRRPDQLLHPYVWDEDGLFFEQDIRLSWFSVLFRPQNGYLLLIPKLIHLASVKISFFFYPEVSVLLTLIFNLLVILAVRYSPTYLKFKTISALAIILIPHFSEEYLLPVYTLWFAAILGFLPLFFESKVSGRGWRIARVVFVIIAGFSSPILLVLLPLYFVRLVVFRKKDDLYSCFAGLGAFLTQAYFLSVWPHTQLSTGFGINTLLEIAKKFFGWYVWYIPNGWAAIVVGVILILTITAVGYYFRRRLGIPYVFLLMALSVTIFSSTARVNLIAIDPFYAGPRYFFLPYILLTWTLLYLAFYLDNLGRLAIFSICMISLINSMSRFVRNSDPIDWRKHVFSCMNTKYKIYSIPIHMDGNKANSWRVDLRPQDCRNLANYSYIN